MNTASFRKRRKISKCQIGSAVPKKVDPDKFGADLGLCVTFREKNIKRKISACLFFQVVRRTVFQCNSSARQSSLMSGQTLERVRAFRPLEEFRRTFPLHARRTVVSQIERKKCQNSSIKMRQKFAWNGQNHIITISDWNFFMKSAILTRAVFTKRMRLVSRYELVHLQLCEYSRQLTVAFSLQVYAETNLAFSRWIILSLNVFKSDKFSLNL